MHLASLRYTRPDSIAGALAALARTPGARVLAGGQSLVNALKLRAVEVELLVDVTRLEELHGIELDGDGGLTIGAATTYRELADSQAVHGAHPRLAEIADHLVDRQVRARGTIGGNCCFNDPLSNLPPLFVALDATFTIAGKAGDRVVSADDFFHGPYATAVAQGELLRSIALPALPAGAGVGYSSLQISPDSWALARAAVLVTGNGTVESARVALGCVVPGPARQAAVEQALTGGERASLDAEAAAATAGDDVDFIGDSHASAGYRHKMARVVTARAIAEACSGGTK